MIVFKTFLKILNKNKGTIILYTFLLVSISYFNMQNNDTSISFESSKPDVYIIDNDNSIISNDFVNYMKENSNIINIKNTEESILDAIFFRDVNYIIIIPNNYTYNLLNGGNPEIEVKTTNDYLASLAERIMSRYIKLVSFYKDKTNNQEELVSLVRSNLVNNVKVSLTSKLDTATLTKISTYYDFANYTIIASLVFVICIILNTFKKENIAKRIAISGMNYKKFNKYLLISNICLSMILFVIYNLLAYSIIGNKLFTFNGIICIINMFIFIICSTTFATLLSSLITNKDALSGIINVIALGSSFLCGAFVPQTWLPNIALLIGHIFPSYYYIKSNDLAVNIESFSFSNICPIIINNIILLVFSILFIALKNYISKKKRTFH